MLAEAEMQRPLGLIRRGSPYVRLYLLAFVFFYIAWALFPVGPAIDSWAYLESGRGVFEAGTFGFRSENGLYYPNAFRMPLVPFVLGLLRYVSGSDEYTWLLYTLLQVFIAPILPCTAFFFGTRVSRRVGLLSYILTLTHWNVITHVLAALTDIPFAAFSCLSFVMVWNALTAVNTRRGLYAGIAIGFTCLIRPIMKLYILWAAVLQLLMAPSAWKRRLVVALLMLIGFGVVLTPWLLRNYRLYGEFVLETNQGLNLLWSNARHVRVNPNDTPERRALKEYAISKADDPFMITLFRGRERWIRNDLAVSRELEALARESLRERPAAWAQTWARNVAVMTLSQASYRTFPDLVNDSWWWRPASAALPWLQQLADIVFLVLARLYQVAYAVLAPVGFILMFRRARMLALFVLAHIAYFGGLTAFVAGYDRYRLNIEPFFVVMICLSISTAADTIVRIRSARATRSA